MTDAPVAELLRRDIHPAEIALPDGTVHTGVRAFVTTDRIVAYRATADRSIEKVLDAPLTERGSVEGSRSSLFAALPVETDQGTVLVNRGRGCGCHSPLKGLSTPVPWS